MFLFSLVVHTDKTMWILVGFILTTQLRCSVLGDDSDEGLTGDVNYINVTDFSDPYEINLTELIHIKVDESVKIINGEEADEHQFPYQVAIVIVGFFNTLFCGGSLISKKYVLTAAHCIKGYPERIMVILGTENLKERSKYAQRIDAVRFIRHRKYSTWTLKHDICLLELKNPVEYNDAIAPIELPSQSESKQNYINKFGIVSGFGRTHDGSKVSPHLMYARVKVIDNYVCNKVIYKIPMSYKNICTKGKYNRGSCHGDSGGPFVIGHKQIGIVSFGGRSCTAGYPTVYTRVPKYIDWISHNTGIDFT